MYSAPVVAVSRLESIKLTIALVMFLFPFNFKWEGFNETIAKEVPGELLTLERHQVASIVHIWFVIFSL